MLEDVGFIARKMLLALASDCRPVCEWFVNRQLLSTVMRNITNDIEVVIEAKERHQEASDRASLALGTLIYMLDNGSPLTPVMGNRFTWIFSIPSFMFVHIPDASYFSHMQSKIEIRARATFPTLSWLLGCASNRGTQNVHDIGARLASSYLPCIHHWCNRPRWSTICKKGV